jgi:endonuclease YncB( thermonuclease family)
MEKKVLGKSVTLRCPDRDRYGRRVCDLFLGGEYVNRELVRAGLAWANTARPRYLRDKSVLEAQREAQELRQGLWASSQPTPPLGVAPRVLAGGRLHESRALMPWRTPGEVQGSERTDALVGGG